MTPDPIELGPYRIVRRVGVGGMGVVYEAIHTGLDKRVALKVLPRAMAANRIERFLREARTAAALHHTNIVPVFDVGQVDGVPYYAMQFIDGQSLGQGARQPTRDAGSSTPSPTQSYTPEPAGTKTFAGLAGTTAGHGTGAGSLEPTSIADESIPAHGKEVRLVVALVVQAAEGLAHAHARGIVHRDVKPSNLLLDASGVVWVADFGLAFRADDPTLTTEGAILGTPRYMSPEQARAEKTDARTDVYSLGVTLYELLTGVPAFTGDTPLSIIQNVIAQSPPNPRALNRDVPRDLETVVLKAMAKRPDDRYPSARELADDLKRFLAGEPVRARRISVFGKAWRWAKRNPVVAALLATVLIVFAGGAAGSAYYAKRATSREGDAKRNELKANELLGELGRTIADLHIEKKKLIDAEADNQRLVYAARISLAGVALRENDHVRVGELLRETFPKPGEPDIRGWEWHYLFRVVFSESRADVWPGIHLANTADSERVLFVIASGKKQAGAIAPDTRKPIFTRDAPADMTAAGLAPRFPASANGKRIVYRTADHLVVWEPESNTEHLRLSLAGHRDSAPPALDGAGKRLARFVPDAEPGGGPAYEVWDVESSKRLTLLAPPKRFGSTFSNRVACFSSDAKWLAVLIDGRRCVVWDVSTGSIRLDRLVPSSRETAVDSVAPKNSALAFDPAGKWLAVRAAGGERVEVFDLAAGGTLPDHTFAPFAGDANAIAFRLDGGGLAIADTAGSVSLFDLTGSVPPRVFRTTHRNLHALQFRPAGRGLVAHADSHILEWDLTQPAADRLTGAPPRATTVEGGTLRPDGRAIAVAGTWEESKGFLRQGLSLWTLDGTPGRFLAIDAKSASWSSNGRLIAAVFDRARGPGELTARYLFTPPFMIPHGAATLGRLSELAYPTTAVRVLDAESGREVQSFYSPVPRPLSVRISPCGRWVAIETGDGFAVFAVADGRPIRVYRDVRKRATAGAFSPDGSRFVLTRAAGRAKDEAEVTVWNLAQGTDDRFAFPGGHLSAAAPLVSPDARWVGVISAARSGYAILVRDTSSGPNALVAEVPIGNTPVGVRDPAFSPDSRWLIVPSGPRECSAYACGTWDKKLVLTGMSREQPELIFDPSGRRVLELHSGPHGQSLKVLDTESGQEVLAFPCSARQSLQTVMPAYFDGNRLVVSRRLLPAGTVEVEQFDGTPIPDELARTRLHLRPLAR